MLSLVSAEKNEMTNYPDVKQKAVRRAQRLLSSESGLHAAPELRVTFLSFYIVKDRKNKHFIFLM